MTGRMTLRVSYDGGRTYGPARTVAVNPHNAVILGSPTKYPPCGCPRCTGRSVAAEDRVTSGLGRWVLRRFGRYAGPLYLAMILGGLVLVLAGAFAVQ
ncbi:hypothetical protein FF041_38005 [Streptomyces jumonjinensis]|uniref:Uncharacterized protein n=1 Tax=Streptomyces jumonjinensis TaxID=1945 RepID=A0A646KTN8_STRJU|nr:hypothetical protein [Streptomyces jumonjinensis]